MTDIASSPPGSATAAQPERLARGCDKCGVNDTHSHHVQLVVFSHPITGEAVDLSVSKHTQCCAADGCDICATHLEHAEAAGVADHTVPSDGFTAYMQAPTDAHSQALFDRHGIESPGFERQAEGEAV